RRLRSGRRLRRLDARRRRHLVGIGLVALRAGGERQRAERGQAGDVRKHADRSGGAAARVYPNCASGSAVVSLTSSRTKLDFTSRTPGCLSSESITKREKWSRC